MTMLANREEGRALTLQDYEARIHLYKEQIGTGYIGIGKTLLEAKEAKVVPHGQWESWVTETTGLTARQAQRCMQAATEIRDGSAMARLEMSKALLLLSSGLDDETREEIAEKAADEGATVKDLREQLKQAKLQIIQETGAATEIREALRKANAEKDQLAQQIQATISAYQTRMDEENAKAYQQGQDDVVNMHQELQHTINMKAMEIKQLRADLENNKRLRQSLEDQLTNARNAKPAVVEKAPEDYESLKRNQADLLAAAEEAEKRAADAEAELEALRSGGAGQPEPAWKVLKVAVTRFMTDCEMMPMDPAALIPEKDRILANISRMEKWTDMMRMALEGVVAGEGAVR